MKKLFFTVAMLSLMMLPAFGGVITLDDTTLQNFTFTGGTNTAAGFVTPLSSGAQFSVIFNDDSGGTGMFDSGTGLNLANSSGDFFKLDFMNSNGSPWTWTVELFDAGGSSLGSASVNPLPGATDTVMIALNGTTIDRIKISVSGSFADDANADANVTPAPEPATLVLLGLGLLSFGALRRKLS